MSGSSRSMCHFDGLGSIPCFISEKYDGVNLEAKEPVKNFHNEKYFEAQCNRRDLANDEFDVFGFAVPFDIPLFGDNKISKGYLLSIYMNSEVKLGLYNNGRVTFFFDAAANSWTAINGSQKETSWLFCSPYDVIETVVTGLNCFADDDGNAVEPRRWMRTIADSLALSMRDLASSVEDIYRRLDCDD